MRRTNNNATFGARGASRTECLRTAKRRNLEDRGVTIVNYEKPEVSVSVQAVAASESHSKPVGLPEIPTEPIKTNPAYEADE